MPTTKDPKTGLTLKEAQQQGVNWSRPTGTTTPTPVSATTPQLGTAEYTQQLLARGNILGQQASQQTGIPYTPVNYQSAPTQPPIQPPTQLTPDAGADPYGTADPYGGIGTGTADTYRQQIMDLMSGMTGQHQSYMDYLKGQPSAMDLFSQYRGELGLPEKEATMQSLQERVQKTTDLINSLEEDIMARSQGKMMTMPLMSRQMAVEQRPLTKSLGELTGQMGVQQAGMSSAQQQLQQMLGLAQSDQERQAQIAGGPFELTKGLLPSMMQAAQYQGPEEQLQQMIAQAQAMQQFDKPGTSTYTDAQGNLILYNSQTGETIQNMGKVGTKAGITPAGGVQRWSDPNTKTSYEGTQRKPTDIPLNEAAKAAVKTLPASAAKIKDWILENKRANPNIPYEDLWGQLADEMTRQGLLPSNYDKIFWEILHPEGLAGYEKYKKGTTDENPFR